MSDFPMTEKLTIKDLNCGNCTTICCGFHPDCVAYREQIFEERVEAVRWFVSVWGCARHPLTLQVLAGPVIAELENMKTNAHKRMNACLDLGYDGNWQGGKEEAFEEAIKLLKEGVKKP